MLNAPDQCMQQLKRMLQATSAASRAILDSQGSMVLAFFPELLSQNSASGEEKSQAKFSWKSCCRGQGVGKKLGSQP